MEIFSPESNDLPAFEEGVAQSPEQEPGDEDLGEVEREKLKKKLGSFHAM